MGDIIAILPQQLAFGLALGAVYGLIAANEILDDCGVVISASFNSFWPAIRMGLLAVVQ